MPSWWCTPWRSKAPDICNELHIKHTTHKTFHWFKSRIQIFLSHTLINTFLPFFADWWLMWEERKRKRSNTSWKKKEQDNYLWSSRALWTLGSSDRNLPRTLRCHSSCASTRWRNLRAGKESSRLSIARQVASIKEKYWKSLNKPLGLEPPPPFFFPPQASDIGVWAAELPSLVLFLSEPVKRNRGFAAFRPNTLLRLLQLGRWKSDGACTTRSLPGLLALRFLPRARGSPARTAHTAPAPLGLIQQGITRQRPSPPPPPPPAFPPPTAGTPPSW